MILRAIGPPTSGTLAAIMVLLLAIAGCSESEAQSPAVPPLRLIALGYEELVSPSTDLGELAQRFADVGATGVGITAGRADWTTFRWEGHEERWAAPLRQGERDPFDEAVRVLGRDRHVSAVVDVFAPELLASEPDLAAVDEHGSPSDEQVSISGLTRGEHGDRLLEMIAQLSARDDVDSIDLTELHYDQYGFGADDLELYQEYTGSPDWPRDADGDVDLADAELGQWRSAEIGAFVARAAEVAHGYGKELFVDVRVSWDRLSDNSRDNGQDYEVLLEHADRLVVWNYFGLTGAGPEVTDELTQHLADLGAERFIHSVGLWTGDEGQVSASDLAAALEIAEANGIHDAWITPLGMIENDHWDALRSEWR